MSKTKILMIQIAACIALGTILGIAFWLFDGGRACKNASDCAGGVSNAQKMASAKVYQGQWIEDTKKIGDWWSVGYLQREVIK